MPFRFKFGRKNNKRIIKVLNAEGDKMQGDLDMGGNDLTNVLMMNGTIINDYLKTHWIGTNVDMNDYMTTGIYRTYSGGTNKPGSRWSYQVLEVLAYDGYRVVQKFYSFQESGGAMQILVHIRASAWDGTKVVWGDWVQIV